MSHASSHPDLAAGSAGLESGPDDIVRDSGSQVDAPVVLHVRVVSGAGGGPEKTILSSPRFLTSLGYKAHCAYMRTPNDPGFQHIAAKAAELDAPLIEVDDRGPLDWRVATQLLHVCRKLKVDIWHGHDYKSNALGLLLKRFHRMKLVTTLHGWVKFTRRTPLYYGIDRFSLRYYDRVISVSDDLQQQCLEAGVKADCCVLIKNAIDCDKYQRTQSKESAKSQLHIPVGGFLIGAVGRLSEEKGFETLIRSVDRMIRAGKDVRLIIAGEGDCHARLTKLIAELGQSERIRLLGYHSEMLPIYEAIDYFVLSSLREGLPNVVLEAMAMGVPVIATRVAGVPAVVTDGETGWLIEPGDETALYEKLMEVESNPALQMQIGTAGQSLIARDFSFQRRMQRIATVYDQVLGRPATERTN